MLQLIDQAKLKSNEIMSASKSIEDMVVGYEQFTRREIKSETIDLVPLLQNVAIATLGNAQSEVRLTFPDASMAIDTNGALLRQILSNIFRNSIEAMQGQDRVKEIKVSISIEASSLRPVVLTISDNGEGIPEGNLKSIFERGFSTRPLKAGGLGLHWCANAASTLGGSLVAESDGPGRGTTLVLRLPSRDSIDQNVKEAA